jgi:hypothetical protein
MQALALDKYDTFLIAANDNLPVTEEADARTLMTYLIIEDYISESSAAPQVIVELTDPDNSPLYFEKNCEVIISPLMVSYTLSQVALRRKLKPVYDLLFSSDSAEIALIALKEYGITEGHYSFRDLYISALDHSQIAIGFSLGSGKPVLNPPALDSFRVTDNDRLIVLQNNPGEKIIL